MCVTIKNNCDDRTILFPDETPNANMLCYK